MHHVYTVWCVFKLFKASLQGQKKKRSENLAQVSESSLHFWRLEQRCLHISLANIKSRGQQPWGEVGWGSSTYSSYEGQELPLSQRPSATLGTPNKHWDFMGCLVNERRTGSLLWKAQKGCWVAEGGVWEHDEGAWICYPSLLRNGSVWPQPLKWRMEIRTHAFAHTVLMSCPQVHLELTCPGTILFPTMGGDPIRLSVFIYFTWVTRQKAPIQPLCLTFPPGLSGSVCVYVPSWWCDGVVLHPGGKWSLPRVICESLQPLSLIRCCGFKENNHVTHFYYFFPAHVTGDTGKRSGPPESEVLLTQYLAFVF